jgi:hypothetical protein
MKKLFFLVLIGFLSLYLINNIYALGGKTLRVKLCGLDECDFVVYRAQGIFEFSTIFFEPNDDFNWHNHTSSDWKRVELTKGQDRFIVKSKGLTLTTLHRLRFIYGRLDLAIKPKNGKKSPYNPIVSIRYYSKKQAKKEAAYRKSNGENVRIKRLDGSKITLVPYKGDLDEISYHEPNNIIYYGSPNTDSFAIDLSKVKIPSK